MTDADRMHDQWSDGEYNRSHHNRDGDSSPCDGCDAAGHSEACPCGLEKEQSCHNCEWLVELAWGAVCTAGGGSERVDPEEDGRDCPDWEEE